MNLLDAFFVNRRTGIFDSTTSTGLPFICRPALMVLTMMLTISACGNDDKQATIENDTGTESACAWDDNDDSKKATALTSDTDVQGYICPRMDEDWYVFTVPAGQNLATITVHLDAPVSPLDLVYSIWDAAGKNVVAKLSSTETIVAGETLTTAFFLTSGTYNLQLRDMGSDAQDVYHPYSLSLQTAADGDKNEPNNDAKSATPANGGQSNGYISYDGDEDWYSITGNARGIVRLHLTMPVATVAPAYKVVNAAGEVVVDGGNAAGTNTATDITYDLAINSADAWYVVISGTEPDQSDASVPYTLTIEVLTDPDTNESNDHPSTATEAGTMTCGDSWSEWNSMNGYIASAGDVDWFHVDASDCSNGIVEVELSFDAAGSLPADFIASVSLVREVSDKSCTMDQECQLLSTSCDNDLDCGYLGNSCVSGSVCAGAGVCMPTGKCAANWAVFQGTEKVPATVHFSAPLQKWSDAGDFYIAVSDTHGVSYAIGSQYTLRAKVMNEMDKNEISGAYTTHPPTDDDSIYAHLKNAVAIPVHDCTQTASTVPDTNVPAVDSDSDTDTATADSETVGDTDTVDNDENTAPSLTPGCCGPNDWVEGYISYNYDEDWYAYPHPCPGEDCMVRVLYDIGAGPVDTYVRVFQGGSAWYDNITSVKERSSQSAISGSFGGLSGNDSCFYAYNQHTGDPFWYYLSIRDTIFVSQSNPEDGTWDWSTSQPYRFCVEKVAAGCQAPCEYVEGDGCNSPG